MPFDLINGLFELIGGCLIWLNVRALWRDRFIAGVHWGPVVFFTGWGIWNLFYYPHLGQVLSFLGGIWMVVANVVWISLLIYFSRKGKK